MSTTPDDLGTNALKVWDSVTGTYALRGDELRVLEDACREIDLVDQMQTALAGADLVVKGSQGQPVANPLVQELRQHRAMVQRLLSSLKLPDSEEVEAEAAGKRSANARSAANARWGKGKAQAS